MSDASFRRRCLALVIDLTAIGGIAAAIGGVAFACSWLWSRVAELFPRFRPDLIELDAFPTIRPTGPGVSGHAVGGAFAPLVITQRNWRSWGYRAAGVRRVDAATGGRVTVGSAIRSRLFDDLVSAALNPMFQTQQRRYADRVRELRPGIEAIERAHAANRAEMQRAVLQFYEDSHFDPFENVKWWIVRLLIRHSVFWGTRQGRDLRTRLTGTRVIINS